MASLATCPLCAKHLAIPKEASPDDRAQCPECDATFLLSNIFQVDLPIVRLLEPAAEIAEETPEVVSEVDEQTPAEMARSVPTTTYASDQTIDDFSPSKGAPVESLASWESRLKLAIQQDAAELTEQCDALESTADKIPLSARPEFDFHLDPPPAEQSEVAEAVPPNLPAQPLPTENNDSLNEEFETITKKSFHKEVAPNRDEPRITRSSPPQKRSRKLSALKVAALVVGPGVIGIFLGLYALLWIKGPSGDLANIAQYLPAVMLPAPEASEDSAVAPDVIRLLAEDTPAAPPALPKSEPSEPRRDEAVQQAAAVEPASEPANTLPEAFGQLLSAAQTALPNLVTGDLNSNEAVASKGRAYMTICQLAQQLEMASLPGLDTESQAEAAAAVDLFDTLPSHTTALADWASITSRWWGYEARPNQGIFLVGRIQNVQALGNYALCSVALDEPAAATRIPVLLEQPPGENGERIVVVGRIVAQPQSNLQGFTIDLPQVVVALHSRLYQP
ncbi:MAG: hypothetical protein KDA44_08100 [Planctomycetales bacterium]|nr:hypothetical protein [Planctomycetales bacterium]